MKGIIYKIVCNETGEVYYGSTTRTLNRRMSGHKSDCKQWKEGKCGFTTSFNIIDRGNYSYSLIETVECEEKKQLEARERFYIENNECINKFIPCRTRKEYREANKERYKEYKETNKGKLKEYVKAYSEANKDHLKEYKKAYREANKEAIKEYKRQRYLKAKELINNN
jgi:hypothetical protein